jgi:hypothetical protein
VVRVGDGPAIPEPGGAAPAGSSSKNPITEAQAAARRENGAKGKGPTTPRGKEFSRGNALKHGVYAQEVGLITSGPLREDQEEYEHLREDILTSLPSLATPLLVECGDGVVRAFWKSRRTQRWEVYAVIEVTGSQTKPLGDDLEALAERFAVARDAVLDPNPDTTNLDPGTWMTVVSAVADRDEIDDADWPDGKAEGHHSFTVGQWRALALSFVAKACDGDRVELAAWLLEQHRRCTEAYAAAHGRLAQPAAFKVLTSDVTRTVMRLEQHQSAEVRKALAQYYTELERYREIQHDPVEDEAG